MRTTKFDGDGRRRILSDFPPPPGTRPMNLRRSTARMIIENFLRTGESIHSAQGGTVWVIMEYCQLNKIACTLHAMQYIDDLQLNQQARLSPPIGFRITKD